VGFGDGATAGESWRLYLIIPGVTIMNLVLILPGRWNA